MYIPEHASAYKTAIRNASRPYNTVYGTITFPDSTTMIVNSANMPTNSITISKQCVDSNELMFGGVFMSTLKLSVLTDMSRYAFYNAKVALTFKIKVGEDDNVPIYSEVPLGVFTVSEAERPTNMVTLTADDNMSMLDMDIGGEIISGTPWQVFSFVSAQTGMQLAFTESDLSNFINNTYAISVSENGGIHTYREVVKVVCQMLGCFAYADRQGKLALKMFSSVADDTLTTGDWYSCVPADYQCKYVALSITSMAGTWLKTVQDPNEVGNIMKIEDAPAWDYGSDEAQNTKAQNLFDLLTSIDEYTPCDLSMPSDPTFDCGDRLHLVTKTEPVDILVMYIEWKFHQGMDITSEGINPYTEGSSALTTESTRILNQAVERSKLQFLSFTNASTKVLTPNNDVEICKAEFTPTADTNALFVATILVDVSIEDDTESETEQVEVPITVTDQQGQPAIVTDLQGNPLTLKGNATNTYTYYRDGKCPISIWYTFNGIKVPSEEDPYVAIDNIENGKHIITVSYPITGLTAYQAADWRVYMKCDSGTVTIEALSTKATILGQEIMDSNRISGPIEGFSDIYLEELGHLGVIELTDEGEVTINEAILYNISDDFDLLDIGTLEPITLIDTPQIFMESLKLKRITESGKRRVTEDGKRRVSE